VRVGIGAKIFGTAFLLVLLMTAAAIATSVMVREVSVELTRINDAFVPIAEAVAGVEVHALEQEILFERAIGHLQRTPPGDVTGLLGDFDARGEQVDETIVQARELVAGVLPGIAHVEHREPLVRLDLMLEAIEREHEQFEAHARRVVTVLREGRQTLGAEMLALVQLEEEEFDRTTSRPQSRQRSSPTTPWRSPLPPNSGCS